MSELLQLCRPALFVLHGDQGELIEGLAVGSPVIVCPAGSKEQMENASRAVKLGVGEKILPNKDLEAYQQEVLTALKSILGTARKKYRTRAQTLAEEIRDSGGADRAANLIQEMAPRSKRATVQSRISR